MWEILMVVGASGPCPLSLMQGHVLMVANLLEDLRLRV